MISAATLKVGKKTHKLKFTTRALIRFEEENGGKPFDELLDQLITGKGGASLVASALSVGLDDGKGVDREKALDLIDQAGGVRKVVPFLGEAINAAFQLKSKDDAVEADGEGEPGKPEAPAVV